MSSWRIGVSTVAHLREVRGEVVDGVIQKGGPGTPFGLPKAGPAGGPGGPAPPASADGGGAQNDLAKFADKVTKWIPGDAIAIYLPGVSFFANPNPWWLAIMIVVAGLLVLAAAFATGDKVHKEVWVAGVLASVAFTIWSFAVPSSGWQTIAGLNENKFIVSLAGAIAGSLFAFVAEGITRRMAKDAA